MKTLLRILVDPLVRPLVRRYFQDMASKEDLNNLFVQISALLAVRDLLYNDVPIGVLRGWAISPDALIIILRDLRNRKEPRIIEFGGGESTVAIAALLRSAGSGGNIQTIEHDDAFAENLRNRLNRAGLSAFATVHTVAVRDYPAQLGLDAFQSYDLGSLDIDFDVALVDGPIVNEFGSGTRLVPLRWCIERLRGSRVVYLDDAERQSEREVVEALERLSANLSFEKLQAEKGLLKISAGSKCAA